MSGKKLLSENTVRRFMQLASIEPLSERFIAESPAYKAEDDDITEELEDEELELDSEEDLGAEDDLGDPDAEAPPPEDDLGDLDAEEPGVADMSLTEEEARILIDLGQRLEEALGDDAAVDDLGAPEPDAPVDDMDAELDVDAEEGDLEDEEPPPMSESLVNEVLKRVTKRIIREKLR